MGKSLTNSDVNDDLKKTRSAFGLVDEKQKQTSK